MVDADEYTIFRKALNTLEFDAEEQDVLLSAIAGTCRLTAA